MLRLLIVGMLILALNIQPVKTEPPQNDEAHLTMFSPTLNDGKYRGDSVSSGVMGLKEGNTNSSSSWILFEDAKSPKPPQIEVLRSDEQACVIAITTRGMYRDQVKTGQKDFDKLTIPEYGFTNELGKPQLPAIRGLIEVPPRKNVRLTITTLRSLELSNYTIYPAQEPIPESRERVNENVFQFDQSFYSTDAYCPQTIASISPPTQLRDHIVVQLSVYPIRFNPAINRLNISTSIQIKLEYHNAGEAQKATFNRLSSPSFDEICTTTIWNHNPSKGKAVESEPVGYLMISNDTFYSPMVPFVEWKTANGFNVTSVKLSDIGVGVNDTDIYNYIFDAYHNWTTPPTYVLLVGDVEYLPTHYGLDHPYYEERKTATDHYYACVSGNDYLPDLFVGRLSVKNVTELNDTLNKLIGYNSFFNKRATLVSDYQEGRPFEETSNWIYNLLTSEGYTVDKFYKSLGTATASNIAGALNDGRAIINYRGHGSPTGWAAGSFYNSQVLGLNNEGKLPIVISCTCSTGEYDYVSDCFGETWIKAQGKGAVAFWGSSRVSYSGYNDELSKGVYKAIFNDSLYEFGPITVKAKLYMYNYYGDEFYTHLEYEMYNILTDPQLYTSFPQHELVVDLDSPNFVKSNDSVLLNATVSNIGLCSESNVELSLIIDDNTVNSTTISKLFTESSCTISYLWTPTTEGIYNVTAYASPVLGESYTWNNVQSADVLVQTSFNIIIVADNDGSSYVNGTSLQEFESTLTSAGYDYIVWNESSMNNPSLHFLKKFKLVIWTCGDYWNEAVDPIDAAILESYVNQGGSLLLEGEDIGYDHHDDGFMLNVAHAVYQVDNTGASGLTVTNPTHLVTQGLPTNFTWATDPPYEDGVTPANTGAEVIRYTGTNWTAVTVFEGIISKVVYCAFPLYCLGGSEQETLIIDSVNWLLNPACAVYVDPPSVNKSVGETFTIDVVVADVANLYGVDIQFKWDPSILEYVNHTLKIPVDTYADGIMSEPGMFIKNEANGALGTYWGTYVSFDPAPAFDGTGIAFNLTFRVIKAGGCALEFPKDPITGLPFIDLNDIDGMPMAYDYQDGYFETVSIPMVYVDPPSVNKSVGETFTIDVVVADVANLYGVDIQFKWDPSILEYVSHIAKIPVETYPDGILHEPGMFVMDDVDAVAGTYRVAYASMNPAPPFDGAGTIFEIAFHAKTNGTCVLEIFSSDLVDRSANSIPHNVMSGIVEITAVHDLAVTDIQVSKNVVGQGYCTRINVTIANHGNFHESSNITLFANGTIIDVASATILNSSLITISFFWIISWDKGNYTISSYVTPVLGETNTEDNTLIDGWVFVSISGDVDGDKDVDIYDVVKITGIYRSEIGNPNYKANSDINCDGIIDIYDVVICTSHYAQSW